MSETEILDLTYFEINEYIKCINQEVHDEMFFQAKLHGAKKFRHRNYRRPPVLQNRNISSKSSDKMDEVTQRMFDKMKVRGQNYGKERLRKKVK